MRDTVCDVQPDALIREYLRLALRFDRIESGYVDAFTGDPALRRAVESEVPPDPAELARQADRLLAELPQVTDLDRARADYIGAQLRALACAGRKFAGERVGFVDEVAAYFDVHITKGDPDTYRQAHIKLDEALDGSGPLADRMQAHRTADQIPPARLEECIQAFSSALRDRVRAEYPLPDVETITYEVVTDKPWSGFNYYLGNYRSTVEVNADLKQQMANLPRLVARLHQHVRRGIPPAARLAGRPPDGCRPDRTVRPAAGRAADPVGVAPLTDPRGPNDPERPGSVPMPPVRPLHHRITLKQ